MESFWQDLRFALRMLRKSPGFTTVAVLTLALGIGANTAVFSVVNTVLLRSLPYPHSAQLVYVWGRSAVFDFPNLGLSAPDIADLRAQNTLFSDVAIDQFTSKILTGHGAPHALYGYEVSTEYFPMLGVRPRYGRLFQPSEMQAGQNHEVILSYKLWSEQFGGDPSMVGKTISLDKIPYAVVGIMPPQFHFPYDYGYALPLVLSKADLAARDEHGLPVLARLKPGITVRQAQAQLDTIAARLAKVYPDADKNWSFRAVSMKSELVGDAGAPLLILFGAVGFVLLIACANVGNLFLSRGWARRRELAIRATLGATRGRLIRQLLVESLVVALIGGVCGLLFALWSVDSLRILLPPNPRMAYLDVDPTVLWFTLGDCVMAGLLFGLLPAMLVSRQDLSRAMKESGAGAQTDTSSSRLNSLRQIPVVAEIALALVLLIGATLTLRSLSRLLDVNMGFRTDHILTMRLDFPQYEFAESEEATNFVEQLLAQIRALPGVENAAASLFAPIGGGRGEASFEVAGARTTRKYRADFIGVTPSYFETLGIPILAGRDFTVDDRKGSAPVYIVNKTMTRRLFGRANPIGKRLSLGQDASKKTMWAEIVGEVGDTRNRGPNAPPQPILYMPVARTDFSFGGASLLIHTRTNPQSFAQAIEQRIWSLEKDQPVTNVKTMDQLVANSDAAPRSQTFLLGVFGALGLLLALVGIYGVVSYSVSQRTHEIGIRMALGAEPSQVMRLILAHGLKLALIGVAIGIAASLALTRVMSSLLFGLSATDPVTFTGVTILLVAASLAVCYIPARRAMKVDPMVALRYE